MDRQVNQYADLLLEQSKYADGANDENAAGSPATAAVPESVHIILFRPDTPEQHAHTVEFPKGSGNNLMLAFESGSDCANFARMLRDLGFADPQPEETVFEPFSQYCEMSGLSLMIVPKGFELTPPQMNANDDSNDEINSVVDDVSILEDVGAMIDDNGDGMDAWG